MPPPKNSEPSPVSSSSPPSYAFEEMKATLFLEDGSSFTGHLFGHPQSLSGELVFQTGMCGYVESLTDPSYAGQFLILTYPLIGNYGVADDSWRDEGTQLPAIGFESHRIWAAGLIVDRVCPEGEQSHWSAVQSLSEWLRKQRIPGLWGIDVRQLTKKIREHGTLKAKLVLDADDPQDYNFVDINASNLVASVSRKEPHLYESHVKNNGRERLRIVAVDYGMKFNQIRCFLSRGCSVYVVPHDFPIDEQLAAFDGLFLSNGPGDPAMCSEAIGRLEHIIRASTSKSAPIRPILGICLGHQLLARAVGATTHKLPYGNRGHNQPCTHAGTGRCFITSQNHGFAVDAARLPAGWESLFTNENDGTNEGIVHTSLPYFSVQFHPEHAGGPTDLECLFDVFLDAVRRTKRNNNAYVMSELINEKLRYRVQEKKMLVEEAGGKLNVGSTRKVLILGSGGLSIGQAGEFDYSGTQAIKALKEEGIRTVLVNPNVATVQTSKDFADKIYFLPITKEYVTDVIKKERPSGLLCTFGGQTALNCAVDLFKDGVLTKYGVEVLGTPIEAVMRTEDREVFKQEVVSIGEQVAPSVSATSVEEAEQAASLIGYPLLVRAAFALGGLGSGFASNREELVQIARQAFAHSNQVLVDKSLRGWKEVEYEVVRDRFDNCVTVCNMENIDPVGIHTGESVVVAPSQTLTDDEYYALRETAIKVIRHFGIVGECNIQYALNPHKLEYYIIEVNARLSRSSALASKATGYPLAYIAAKLALGRSLRELRNSVTGKTTACFEPSLDYCVVKIPRWDLGKFVKVNTRIGSSMKSVGEVMGIGRSFEEAFQKALRMVNEHYEGFSPFVLKRQTQEEDFTQPTDKRMFAIARALYKREFSLEQLYEWTKIDRWFLYKMRDIIGTYTRLRGHSINSLPPSFLLEAKQLGFSDAQIARTMESTEGKVRELRKHHEITPFVKQIDTVAAEWPAVTNYLYLTYNGREHDVELGAKARKNSQMAVAVLGSGVYRIGSSVEFDACSVGCVGELKRLGYQTIMINCNPETVSTDYDICDRLYFEEISLESVSNIYELERPAGAVLAFGGQAANNIALSLQSAELELPMRVFGTLPKYIDEAEDRYKFSRALDELRIKQPQWKNATSVEEALKFGQQVGYPCLIRPSYVLSGAAMNVAHNADDLTNFLGKAASVAKDKPVVVSKFIVDAKEIDVDVVAITGRVLALAISEHVENAGIHSGDATLVTPPQDINEETEKKIKRIVHAIAQRFKVTGPFNMQLIAKNNELFVIECNLRVSRSFPFVSKTLDFDFVALATRAMMFSGTDPSIQFTFEGPSAPKKVGVKVPQFSFSRLAGADVVIGVEMASTGEVACFGPNRHEAYLKGLLSTGFTIPKKSIFVSIGGVYAKEEMLPSVRTLAELGFTLYASKGTADFYSHNGIEMKDVDWPFEEGGNGSGGTTAYTPATHSTEKIAAANHTLSDFVSQKHIDFMINLPIRGSGSYRVSAFRTHGYRTRRMAIDNGIPLITDIKCAKLFVTALRDILTRHLQRPPMNSQFDCISSECLIRLPGLIDVHVHMRQPGGEHKETWESGTKAAVAGGITLCLAMPNTNPPLVDEASYELVEALASANSYCDYALYCGATSSNCGQITPGFAAKCAGLKMYLNDTFSALRLHSTLEWVEHLKRFPPNRPVVCHAEGQTLAAALMAAELAQRPVHICHVSTAEEITLIRMAKERGQAVTCEVSPHHLLLTADCLAEGWREVRPPLSTSAKDGQALWDNIDHIDCFATDHAPHTMEEKRIKSKPPPGLPSIEYMLPLLLTEVAKGRLTLEQLVDRLYHNPRRIFQLPEQPQTHIEVDMTEKWTIPEDGGQSKAGWSPYAGREVQGQVRTVVIRGEEVYVDGNFTAQPGFGRNIRRPSSMAADAESNSMSEAATGTAGEEKQQAIGISVDQAHRPSINNGVILSSLLHNPLHGQHIISVTQFTNKDVVSRILDLANRYHSDAMEGGRVVSGLLRRQILALVFYEPSTRTLHSFDSAMKRLDGKTTILNLQHSSALKGESLEDTIQMMAAYSDAIVLRHPEASACEKAVAVSRKPIINGGDGTGEHPTQALLDLYTIRQELSTVNGKTVAMVGDLKHGRTVHSLAKILCLYSGITLHYVSPTEELGMPAHITRYVEENSNFVQRRFTSLLEGIRGVDIVYMTRIQKERFTSVEEYERVKNSFVLTPKLLNQASPLWDAEENVIDSDGLEDDKPRRPTPIIMHPLPRVNEISTELDKDPRAVFMRQAQYGVYKDQQAMEWVRKVALRVRKVKEIQISDSLKSHVITVIGGGAVFIALVYGYQSMKSLKQAILPKHHFARHQEMLDFLEFKKGSDGRPV